MEDHDEEGDYTHNDAMRKFTLIDALVYPLPHVKKLTSDETHECTCSFPKEKEDKEDACSDCSCLNFATYVECDAATCPAMKYCQNQRLQKKKFPELKAFKVGDDVSCVPHPSSHTE